MNVTIAYPRGLLRAVLLFSVFASLLGLAGAAPPDTTITAKVVVALVSNASVLVEAAVKAEARVKTAITGVEKAKPATAKAAADTLQKAKVALEEAKKVARARLDAVAPYVALDLIPKSEMDKLRKRMAELSAKLAAIPSY